MTTNPASAGFLMFQNRVPVPNFIGVVLPLVYNAYN